MGYMNTELVKKQLLEGLTDDEFFKDGWVEFLSFIILLVIFIVTFNQIYIIMVFLYILVKETSSIMHY